MSTAVDHVRTNRPANTLTTLEAAERCGLSVQQFEVRQRNGWIELNMKQLLSIKRKGRQKYYYHVSDVNRLAELLQKHSDLRPGWIDEYIFRDPEGDWITATGAEQRFEINIRNWKDSPCRFNDNKIITHQNVPRGRRDCGIRRDGLITVYLLKEVRQISQTYKSHPKNAPHWDDAGIEWWPGRFLKKELKVSSEFVHYWAKKKSILRKGENALRSQRLPNVARYSKGSHATILFYRVEDARAIIRGEETRHEGAGRAIYPISTFAAREKEAVEVLKKILAGGPKTTAEIHAEAEAAGVSVGDGMRLIRARESLGVIVARQGRKGPKFWRLPNCTQSGVTTACDNAAAFLKDLLSNGPIPAKDGLQRCRKAGHSVPQIGKGRELANIRSTVVARPGSSKIYVWHLDGQDPHAYGLPYRSAPVAPSAANEIPHDQQPRGTGLSHMPQGLHATLFGGFTENGKQEFQEALRNQPTTDPNDTEKAILSMVSSERLPGKTIAKKLGLSYDYVRGVLASLRKRGLLDNNDNGYLTNV